MSTLLYWLCVFRTLLYLITALCGSQYFFIHIFLFAAKSAAPGIITAAGIFSADADQIRMTPALAVVTAALRLALDINGAASASAVVGCGSAAAFPEAGAACFIGFLCH